MVDMLFPVVIKVMVVVVVTNAQTWLIIVHIAPGVHIVLFPVRPMKHNRLFIGYPLQNLY